MPADNVEVMPGLVGVVASFSDPLPLPESKDKSYSVTVTTNDGFDTLSRMVVSPELQQNEQEGDGSLGVRLQLAQRVLETAFSGATSTLEIPLTVLEKHYPGPLGALLEAKIYPRGNYKAAIPSRLDPYLQSSVKLVPGGTGKISEIPGLTSGTKTGAGYLAIDVRLPVEDGPNGVLNPKDVIQGPHLLLLIDTDSKKFTVDGSKERTLEAGKPIQIGLNFPVNMPPEFFKEAYPDFATAAENKEIRLEMLAEQQGALKRYLSCPMEAPSTAVENGLIFLVPAKDEDGSQSHLDLSTTNAESKKKLCRLRLMVKDQEFPLGDKITLKLPD